ncbi:glucosaminidase domain-containing protein [Thalassotalea agarivorans]|uniref:Bax protein n=1 Tax=Thalassotalea agarivorans TaxID=349064 RepID=A0A1I0EUJ6_THASX|nr:glucosaminidase domain-containing protein [Thalassotalea agarivorans]SET48540.1 Bax protein [Thalassotalea agarivorans]
MRKRTLKSKLFRLLLLVAIAVGVIAPFTFLTPEQGEEEIVAEPVKVKEEKVEQKTVEQPLHSVNLPDFAAITDVKQKKRAFFNFLKPAIERENERLLSQRAEIVTIKSKVVLEESVSDNELAFIAKLAKQYRVNTSYSLLQQLDELLLKVDIIPTELVLVQAANESAWGTSRFAKIGLNFFGLWCYKPGCGMVPNGRNRGAKHEVAAFQSVDEAVVKYIRNINTHGPYNVFRAIRADLRAHEDTLRPEVLTAGLIPYSQRGTDYVIELNEMLRHNAAYFEPETKVIVIQKGVTQ